MTLQNKLLGIQGEKTAAGHLARLGYEIISRNVRTPYGEVDLIANYSGFIVFLEVKARRSRSHGLPEEAITARKKSRLLASAQYYLQQRGLLDAAWRIDVVAVEYGRAGRLERIEVFENAVSG
jgi:putative endonuclease